MVLESIQPLNGNECGRDVLGSKGGRRVGLTTLEISCADCVEILDFLKSCNRKGLFPGLCRDRFSLLETMNS
jgi:hypothetical protein